MFWCTKLASISSPTPPPTTPRIRRNLMHGYTLPPSIPSPSVVVPIPVSSPSLLVSLPVPVTLSGSNVTGFLTVDGIISPIVPHRRVCQLDPGLRDLARKNQTIRADQILIRVLEKSDYMDFRRKLLYTLDVPTCYFSAYELVGIKVHNKNFQSTW